MKTERMRGIETILAALVSVLLVIMGAPVMAEEAEPELPSVEEVNRHLDQLYRAESSRARIKMTDPDRAAGHSGVGDGVLDPGRG